MKIIACYKLVPEEQDITVNRDGTLNLSKAEPKISQFDLNAIEAAMELKATSDERHVTALSIGSKVLENTKARKDVLSRGPDDLTLVIDESFDGALPHQSAQVLAAAANKIGYDLIICGDGSGDLYAQQVGLLLGQILNVATINGVSKIISANDTLLTVERALEDEVEVLEIPLPAVISVSADINEPRIPAMKAILAASKKPVTVFTPQDIDMTQTPLLVEALGIKAPDQKERQKLIIEGDADEQISAFIEHVRKVMK